MVSASILVALLLHGVLGSFVCLCLFLVPLSSHFAQIDAGLIFHGLVLQTNIRFSQNFTYHMHVLSPLFAC